jgi:hypothetical protein
MIGRFGKRTIMKTRSLSLIALIFFLLTSACQPEPEEKAEQLAREQMIGVIGATAVDRSVIEVRPSKVGWMVIFRDANASCDEGSFWPGACRFANRSFIRQMGTSSESESLDDEDLCQVPGPVLPTAEPNP